jgi:hypothetical protein
VYLDEPLQGTHEARLRVLNASSPIDCRVREWSDFASGLPTESVARLALHSWVMDKDPQARLCLVELDVELLTGRTHQIRAQLQRVGWHLAGDNVYSGQSSVLNPNRFRASPFLALQAHHLSFPTYGDPISNAHVECWAPDPWWSCLQMNHAAINQNLN